MNNDEIVFNDLGSPVENQYVRQDGEDSVVKTVYANGVILIYTKTPSGFKRVDCNYELFGIGNVFTPNLDHHKSDFYDYF